MKKLIRFLGMLVSVVIFNSCEKDEIMSFEGEPAVNFSSVDIYDPVYEEEYSFLTNPEDEHIHEIQVQIMGDAVDHDRTFEVEVINDSLTTANEDQYEILEGTIPAGEFTGTLYIKLFNSPELADKSVSLHLKIIDSQDFQSGNVESDEFVISWTNQVVVPDWRWYRYFFTRVPSTAAYRAIVESTGLVDFTISDYLSLGTAGATAMGTKFGDYVMEYNLQHPNDPLRHDDGPSEGELIEPLYYTHSKYD